MESIQILNQTWTTENLATDYYSDGDSIPYATSVEEWQAYFFNKVGCYCYYDYNEQNKKYGKLYNWYAVNDSRGIAPKGWRVGSDADWETLVDALGGSLVAGKFLKNKQFNQSYQIDDKVENLSKLNVLPSGYHGDTHSQLLGFNAHFWTSTAYLEDYAFLRFVTYRNDFVGRSFDYKSSGFVVRLIKSAAYESVFVTIGKQQWSRFNVATTHFANGDAIPIARTLEELSYFSHHHIACCSSYNFDDNLVPQFGRLYNWYAVNDPRGLIDPTLGHIPTDDEWTELVRFLGGEKLAGGRLKSSGEVWGANNAAKDEFSFSAQPAGYFGKSHFDTLKKNAIFWSATEYMDQCAWLRLIYADSTHLDRGFDYKPGGYSIRFIKNNI